MSSEDFKPAKVFLCKVVQQQSVSLIQQRGIVNLRRADNRELVLRYYSHDKQHPELPEKRGIPVATTF